LEATRNQSHPTTWGQLVLSRFPIPALTLRSSELPDWYRRGDRLERRVGETAASIRPIPYDEPNMHNQNFTVALTNFQSVGFRSSRAYSDGYVRAIRQYRLLEKEEEQQLARRCRKLGEQKAADALITSHLRLAATVARRYQRYGLPLPTSSLKPILGWCSLHPDLSRATARAFDLCAMVDQGSNSRLHSAFLVTGQDWHHSRAKEVVLWTPARNKEACKRAGSAECGNGRTDRG
jgi:hypothetical protein